jgi:hypothetical protein
LRNNGKGLILAGIVGVVYSIFMDVTNGEYVNVHLLSKQQNMLILSGILFIAGIVLYAVKPGQENSVKNTDDEETPRIKSTTQAGLLLTRAKKALSQPGTEQIDTAGRFLTALFVGGGLGLVMATMLQIVFGYPDLVLDFLTLASALAMIGYMHKRNSHALAIKLHTVNARIFISLSVLAFLFALSSNSVGRRVIELPITTEILLAISIACIPLTPALISLVARGFMDRKISYTSAKPVAIALYFAVTTGFLLAMIARYFISEINISLYSSGQELYREVRDLPSLLNYALIVAMPFYFRRGMKERTTLFLHLLNLSVAVLVIVEKETARNSCYSIGSKLLCIAVLAMSLTVSPYLLYKRKKNKFMEVEKAT